MRLAVALPSLEAAAPQRQSLDAMLAHLAEMGHDVEGFAEHDRTEEDAPFPVFHYLRMPERHRTDAFETALYPLGRDALPYQGVYSLMHRFPGVVWFYDAIVHHLALGGIGLMGDWGAYRELLDDTYGRTGAAVTQTVASNWGTGALFRRYDLVAAAAARQTAVLAAWPALGRRIASRLDGRRVAVVPLALNAGHNGGDRSVAHRAVGSVAIMSVNESYATTAVRAAAAVFERTDDVAVRICMSEPIYKAEGGLVAEHMGIHERIDWELTTSPGRLSEVAAENDVLLWLAEELQGGHRGLLLEGMAEGKLTVVPRCSLYDDLPEGAVAKLDLGRPAGPTFGALLRALRDDEDLRQGLAANAVSFAASCADVAEAGRILESELEAAAALGHVEEASISALTWQRVMEQMANAALPPAAEPAVEQQIVKILSDHTGGVN